MNNRVTVAAIALAFMILAGCAGFGALESTDPGPNAGRYALAQDRGPAQTLSYDDVEDVEVVFEPPSRGGNSDYTLFGQHYEIMPTAEGYVEEGYASWYGEKFHGHTTSNGETYDMYQVTAAHKTLPLPTFVEVTNLENGESVIARVNDRGPFHEDRIIDMSYAAAVRLGFANRGVARVRVEALTPGMNDTEESPEYWLQFGAFSQLESARRARASLAQEFDEDLVINEGGDFHRVRMGPLTYDRAEAVQEEWLRKGNDKPLIINP